MSPYHIVYSIFSKIMVCERIKKINMPLKISTHFPSISALLWYFSKKCTWPCNVEVFCCDDNHWWIKITWQVVRCV